VKKVICIILVIPFLFIVGCYRENTVPDALKFKNDYEYFNEKENPSGQKYKTVFIPENNPIIYSSYNEIVSKINTKESFAVFFAFPRCPWCRMYVETMIASAIKNDVKSIYYVDVYTSRDEYKLDENNNAYQVKVGEEGYSDLLNLFSEVLDNYTIDDSSGNAINTELKRIYAPNLIIVNDGVAIKLVSDCGFNGDPYGDLTESVKKNALDEYDDAFKNLIVSEK